MIVEQDSRTAAADRAFHKWVQRGCDPATVAAMLPALVGPQRVAQQAAEWLSANARVGNDLSPEGQRTARAVTNAAREFVTAAKNAGEFTGHPVFQPGSRYTPSEAEANAELDRQRPNLHYPGAEGNARRLALSKLEADAQTRHRDSRLVLHDDGRLTAPDGHVVETLKVPEQRTLRFNDTSPQRPNVSTSDSGEHYSKAGTGQWESGSNRPFFADADD